MGFSYDPCMSKSRNSGEEASVGSAGGAAREEELVLQLTYQHLLEHGEWPELKILHRHLVRELHEIFDVRHVASRLAPSPYARFHTYEERLILDVETLARLPEAAPLIDHFLNVIRLAARLYLEAEGDAHLSSSQIQQELGVDDSTMRALDVLLDADLYILRGKHQGDDGWVREISEQVHRFRGAQTFSDYLDVHHGFEREHREAAARAADAHYRLVSEYQKGIAGDAIIDIERQEENQEHLDPRDLLERIERSHLVRIGGLLTLLIAILAAIPTVRSWVGDWFDQDEANKPPQFSVPANLLASPYDPSVVSTSKRPPPALDGPGYWSRISFRYFGPECQPNGSDYPCYLPLRTRPDFRNHVGKLVTEGWPSDGAWVWIRCRVSGNGDQNEGVLRDIRGVTSNIWNVVYLGMDREAIDRYAYGNNIWFGDTIPAGASHDKSFSCY